MQLDLKVNVIVDRIKICIANCIDRNTTVQLKATQTSHQFEMLI